MNFLTAIFYVNLNMQKILRIKKVLRIRSFKE